MVNILARGGKILSSRKKNERDVRSKLKLAVGTRLKITTLSFPRTNLEIAIPILTMFAETISSARGIGGRQRTRDNGADKTMLRSSRDAVLRPFYPRRFVNRTK